jgi:alkylation response protein AidB-like acyl-CoA dehydrogenase
MPWAIVPLSEEQRAIQDSARQFARSELSPHVDRWDRDSYFEPSLPAKLGALGFMGMLVPERYDGLGLDTASYLVALEEIAAVDACTALLMSVHNSLVTQMLLRWGSEEQRERFLRPLARGEKVGAFALSEPEAGSDAASLRTQAIRQGDHWILEGVKSWVTNGSVAGVILAMARTDTPSDRRGARGIGTFIVTPDLPGFCVGKKEEKLGLRASPTVQLVFDRMVVPAENLLGDPGNGFVQALQALDFGRLGIAAQAIGIGRAALEYAAGYAAERRQFGKPIKEFQAIQFKLADMVARISAARALLYAAAAAKERGEPITQFAAMSKLVASEAAVWVTSQAIQILGGYGYVRDYPVERYFRDAKATEIYEGTSEILRVVIARELYARR